MDLRFQRICCLLKCKHMKIETGHRGLLLYVPICDLLTTHNLLISAREGEDSWNAGVTHPRAPGGYRFQEQTHPRLETLSGANRLDAFRIHLFCYLLLHRRPFQLIVLFLQVFRRHPTRLAEDVKAKKAFRNEHDLLNGTTVKPEEKELEF